MCLSSTLQSESMGEYCRGAPYWWHSWHFIAMSGVMLSYVPVTGLPSDLRIRHREP